VRGENGGTEKMHEAWADAWRVGLLDVPERAGFLGCVHGW